ncbi:nibrin isoform X2 [Cynoglossus semilaevis]|uniref:nibrin isoform X2 n=1 Tax=Cynoglossus semilaevis TaxID=244447 RepID=UPI000D62F67B|nr:nibrin-like isoform X2 [Cynoglossus semilaevis]
MTENTAVGLKSGDQVTFGAFNSKFSLVFLKPVVCSSCLDNGDKASLSSALQSLGGKLVNSWTQDCTHLVMNTVKVTIKTISALLCGRPIVRPEFFSELNKAVQKKLPLPGAEGFIPDIDEPSLNKDEVNLTVLPVRRQLFADKTFVFLSAKQLKRLSTAVGFGRGQSRLLEEGSLPRDLLESPQSCVVDATTGSAQTLTSSAAKWAASVKNIVQRKGLRVITESEIGLAAIFASCDKYCNPSSRTPESEAALPLVARLPGASLSQTVAVDETVLPAASQNVTVYAVNTEQPEGLDDCNAPEVTAVGETPEKKQKQDMNVFGAPRVVSDRLPSPPVVPDTLSVPSVDNTESQKKKSLSRLGGKDSHVKSSSSSSSYNVDVWMKTSAPKSSPQKTPAQISPQKQTTLTNFFQRASKKRPLDDEFSTVMSEPKRPVLESSIRERQEPGTSHTARGTHSTSRIFSPAVSQSSLGTEADLFTRRSRSPERIVQEESRSRKRKEMEEQIQMEELESIMSQDMDVMDDWSPGNRDQPTPLKGQSSTLQKHSTVEAQPSSKRSRVTVEVGGDAQQALVEPEKKNQQQKPQPFVVSVKKELTVASENKAHTSSGAADAAAKNRKQKSSLIEDIEGPIDCEEKINTPVEPVKVKQEVQDPRIDENLPKNLLLVEFRSLTVCVPSRNQAKQPLSNSHAKNFKRFRKCRVPGVDGSAKVIGQTDLLVHNRIQNMEVNEWLKEAAEEESQSRRDQTLGDDLFRYNPSKLTRKMKS